MKKDVKNKKRRIIKPSRLVFLIVLLAGNTFAWFIYATKINMDVSVHVRAWNVVFQDGENELSNDITVNVGDIYPGMDNYEYTITAYNHSEVSASLTYQILSARILDDEYVSVEEKQSQGLPITDEDMTAAAIETMLATAYPFEITIDASASTIDEEDGQETFAILVTWPYESNDDETDTYWGTSAYDYKEDNPSSPSIALHVRLTITQNAS